MSTVIGRSISRPTHWTGFPVTCTIVCSSDSITVGLTKRRRQKDRGAGRSLPTPVRSRGEIGRFGVGDALDRFELASHKRGDGQPRVPNVYNQQIDIHVGLMR